MFRLRPAALFFAVAAVTPVMLGVVDLGTPSGAVRSAHASAMLSLTLDDLVDKSDVAVVGIAKSRTSRWEDGRIVSYTTVDIDTKIGGLDTKAPSTVVVRTLGGVVGDIGQKVHGEAVLPLQSKVILFLRELPAKVAPSALPGARSVTGMAQGALLVTVGEDKIARVAANVADLTLVPNPNAKTVPAHVAVAGRPALDVVADLRTLWTAHGKK